MRFIVSFIASAMPIVCGNNRKKAPELSYHRFPSDPGKRVLWLQALHISEEQVSLSWLLLEISMTLISTNNSRSALATAIALEQTSYNVARLLFSLGVL